VVNVVYDVNESVGLLKRAFEGREGVVARVYRLKLEVR
jgi:hypothetical protein